MRKIIDERGRLFGFVSAIDVIVLAAVVILAVGAFTKFRIHDNPLTTVNTENVTYTVRIPATRIVVADLIRPGDNLYTESGIFIGVVKDVSAEDAVTPEPLVDGTFVLARVHERYDVLLTVEVQCSFSNGRYYADRTIELNANSEHRMITKYNVFTGVILTISAE